MLDYTNLFECDCGALLPFGTTKCPHCGYDYIEPEKWEAKQRKKLIPFWIGLAWFIFAPSIIHLKPEDTSAHILVSLFLPIVLYIWYLNKRIKKYERERYKGEWYDYLIDMHRNGDTSLDKYFGKINDNKE